MPDSAAAIWRFRRRTGYDLTKQTGLKSGSIYPILIRFADRGLLETDWREAEEPDDKPLPRSL